MDNLSVLPTVQQVQVEVENVWGCQLPRGRHQLSGHRGLSVNHTEVPALLPCGGWPGIWKGLFPLLAGSWGVLDWWG